LEKEVNLSKPAIGKVLKLLLTENPSPVAKVKNAWHATPVRYSYDKQRVENLKAIRLAEQAEMQEYLATSDCLMGFLEKALDDPAAGACGRCANCLGRAVVPITFNQETVHEANVFLKRGFHIIDPRKKWPSKSVFAPSTIDSQFIGKEYQASEGRALSTWGDPGWGKLVKNGKYVTGRFDDELVEACVEMLKEWNPSPPPMWITNVPSLTRPTLVAEFASRLAKRLSLPYVPCVVKVKQNGQQKDMQNSTQQVRNLIGVFKLKTEDVRKTPVLLVDDMIDSRWTITIIAYKLRNAGCETVYPFALALNSRWGS
jgi:ATP-dependent DNA helicase RecQ